MHPAVDEYVSQFATADRVRVVDIGSRDINGTVRHLFPNADYIGLDLYEGKDVDIVADGAAWLPDEPVDVVVCCEVFEHTDTWPDIVENAHRMLKPGGRLIVTCAGEGRGSHSAIDGKGLRDDEWYANVSASEMLEALVAVGFVDIDVNVQGTDTRATAVRR